MTEEQLELYRIKLRQDVALTLARGLYKLVATSGPDARTILQAMATAWLAEADRTAVPELGPAYSDLLASEYQSALEDVLKFVKAEGSLPPPL